MRKIVLLVFIIASIFANAQNDKLTSKYHQFDFWLGHWDVYNYGSDTLVGQSHIETIIDSVGVLENYSATQSKYSGKSLNKFNPFKNRWEQYWIDNSGLTIYLTGGIENGKMIMSDILIADTIKGINQIVWEKISDNIVRQTWNLSKDNGETWSVLFDGEYRRK
jgi:hypothetical protein